MSAAFGNLAFETPIEIGLWNDSVFQWRVVDALDDKVYISVKMRADAHAGPEGSPNNYIYFDVDTADRLRFDLDQCIDFVRSREKAPN